MYINGNARGIPVCFISCRSGAAYAITTKRITHPLLGGEKQVCIRKFLNGVGFGHATIINASL